MSTPRHQANPALPSWIKDGVLVTSELKAVVASHTEKLKSRKAAEHKLEAAERLFALIMKVWSLETHLARDAADLVCDELRCVMWRSYLS